MEFDWLQSPSLPAGVTHREIEESFEDPFSIRMMPDVDLSQRETRFYNLGRSVSGRGLFTVFWTDGKRYRVIQSRESTDAELAFYDRKNAEQSN
ncbi:MAG: hypothetical protein Fur0032_11200 [Terrimicrobiaceae bacterium]